MGSCVFPGSFDPVTVGHTDIISRLSTLFDTVYVTVMVNVNKAGLLQAEDRVVLLKKACRFYPNVVVERWDGLLTEYMKAREVKIVIRGVRGCMEFEHEYAPALINRQLCSQVETLMMPSDPALSAVSSSTVREIAEFGGDYRQFIPTECLKDIQKILSKIKNKQSEGEL